MSQGYFTYGYCLLDPPWLNLKISGRFFSSHSHCLEVGVIFRAWFMPKLSRTLTANARLSNRWWRSRGGDKHYCLFADGLPSYMFPIISLLTLIPQITEYCCAPPLITPTSRYRGGIPRTAVRMANKHTIAVLLSSSCTEGRCYVPQLGRSVHSLSKTLYIATLTPSPPAPASVSSSRTA